MAFDKESTFVLGNSMKKLDFSGRVRGMRCPVLIICGEKDRSNIRSAQYLSQNIPGAELQLIEHTGHVVNEENPKALAERLNKFYSPASLTAPPIYMEENESAAKQKCSAANLLAGYFPVSASPHKPHIISNSPPHSHGILSVSQAERIPITWKSTFKTSA